MNDIELDFLKSLNFKSDDPAGLPICDFQFQFNNDISYVLTILLFEIHVYKSIR